MADPNQPHTAAILACKTSKEEHKVNLYVNATVFGLGSYSAFASETGALNATKNRNCPGYKPLIYIIKNYFGCKIQN